jgi:hypothetical protein
MLTTLNEGTVYHLEFSNGERSYLLVTGRLKNGNYSGLTTTGRKKPTKISLNKLLAPGWIETHANEIPKVLTERREP